MNLTRYAALRYHGIWPGIELNYEAESSGMKAEYVVAPGAALDNILLRFDTRPKIHADGSLGIQTETGEFIEAAPVLYQTVGGERITVRGGFRETPDGSIGFWASGYDVSRALVIDPSILFSGYFGGSVEDNITAVGIDNASNVVVAGWTASTDLPASNGFRRTYGGSVDAFVASFLPNGGGLIYCTYLGGSGDDRAFGLTIDSSRNVYVTGWTSSTNFPTAGAIQTKLGGTRDAFVTKLNPSGSALIYSTYLGGSAIDVGYAITLDSANEAVVAGDSTSTNLPVSATAIQKKTGGGQDGFVAKLSAAGNSLIFLTYLGGSGIDHCASVALGSNGGVVIGGYTWSQNFPAAGAFLPIFQSASGGGQDGFVVKLFPDGSRFTFSTYFGGSGGSTGAPEQVNSVVVDTQNNITVAGTTSSANFPVTPSAFQTTFGGQTDGFVAHFGGLGNLLYSTYLGGSSTDGVNAVALDFHGTPYVTGFTASQDFPVRNPLQSANAGGQDAFAVKLTNTLSAVTFGTYLGGSGGDAGNGIAVDFETSIIIAGQTNSGNFPLKGSLGNYSAEVISSFIAKIAPNFTVGVAYPVQSTLTAATDPWHVATDVQSTVFGNATDLPVTGDWTRSGVRRIGIFRNGTWILDTNGNGVIDASDKTVVFGQAGDIPVVGDWRGTGSIALGLFRAGTFILDLSGHLSGVPTGLADATFSFGQGGDKPVAGDWSGSGTAKVGIFRNGLWLVDYTGSQVFANARSYTYGQAGDLPVVGDWDSSAAFSKIGVYRNGLWILDYDGDNTLTTPYVNEMVIGFGVAGYTPLVY
jgi:hypothetical protein